MAAETTGREVRGARGLPLLGETVAFLADVKRFIDTRVAQYGPTFSTNLFRMSTIFTCSYHTGAAVLLHSSGGEDEHAALDAGAAYAPMLTALYPAPNLIVAADGADVRGAQLALLDECLRDAKPFATRATRLADELVALYAQRAATTPAGVCDMALYAAFKPLVAQVMVEAVLGDTPLEQRRRIRTLCTEHFNGVAAVPLSVSAFGARSARAAGVQAYHELTRLLAAHVARRVRALRERDDQHDDGDSCSAQVLARLVLTRRVRQQDAVQVLLTLLSPAVAKAVASTATLAVAVVAEERHQQLQLDVATQLRRGQVQLLDGVLMETLRLYPPLAGAVRCATRDTSVHGLRVRAGAAVWLSYLHANRDAAAFARPTVFDTTRWTRSACPFAPTVPPPVSDDASADDASTPPDIDAPLSFGAGARHCRGRHVAWELLRRIVAAVLLHLDVAGPAVRDHHMRYMPVLRPRHDALVRVRPRQHPP
ncbi:unnamed protein product [Agarophyton chilense]|eukprot:gb/GEZJ01004319.1/.p1 GENE.gb/GEZJ01004319.1/~~gb/GEZJ01004319.1/.p1  ORF type:complete len:482 (-),score=64.55 gb/GEZJ01004319.1/:162-1607(-)